MNRYNVGNVLVKKEKGKEPIYREIIEVRETGYSWKYPDVPHRVFYSEDSSDPFFEWKWVKVK